MSESWEDENGDMQSVYVPGSATGSLEQSLPESFVGLDTFEDSFQARSQSPTRQAEAREEGSKARASGTAPSVDRESDNFKDAELIAKTHQKCLFDRAETASEIFKSRLGGTLAGNPDSPPPYKHVSMVTGKSHAFMNSLTSVKGASDFLSMPNQYHGLLCPTPSFRLTKVVYDGPSNNRKVVKEVPINFLPYVKPKDKVTLNNITYELGGTNSVSALSDIKMQIVLTFNSFDGLLKEYGEEGSRYKFIDLATKLINPDDSATQDIDKKGTPTKKGEALIAEEGFYEIRLDLFYLDPKARIPEKSRNRQIYNSIPKDIRESVAFQKRTFFLTPIDASFDFNEFGTFNFTIDYRARIAQVLAKDRAFNILSGSREDQEKILIATLMLEQREETLKKLQKQVKNATSEKQKEIINKQISELTEDFDNQSEYTMGWLVELLDTDEGMIDVLKRNLEEAQEKAANKAYRKFMNFLLTREKLYFAKVVTKDDKIYFRIDRTFDAMGAGIAGLSLDRAEAEFVKLVQENMQEVSAEDFQFDEKTFLAAESQGFGLRGTSDFNYVQYKANRKTISNQSEVARFVRELERQLGGNWENYPHLTDGQRAKLKTGQYNAEFTVLQAAFARENERRRNIRQQSKKAAKQGKGGTAKPTADQLTAEQEGSYYIPWFFLGDLIEFASKEAFENYVNPDRKKYLKNIEGVFNEDFVKRTKVLLGPVEYKKENGSPTDVPISLAEMPVSFEFFKKWWKANVVDQKKRTYSLANFIQACMREFMIEKFYLEPSDSKDTAKQLVPKKQVVDLPIDTSFVGPRLGGEELPLPPGRLIEMTKLLTNPPNHATMPPGTQYCHYLTFFMQNSQTDDLTGNRAEDIRNNIPHLDYRTPATQVKSVSFEPVDVEGLRQMKAFEAGAFDPLSELARVYNLKIDMRMNFCFWPGQTLFFNPLGFGVSLGAPPNRLSVSRKLGIGGYHLVTNVKGKFDLESKEYTTTVEARWQTSGGEGSRGLFSPQGTTGDGATPVSPTESPEVPESTSNVETDGSGVVSDINRKGKAL